MKHEKRLLTWVLLFATIAMPLQGFLRGRSFFNPRSQSAHLERGLVGFNQEVRNGSDECCGVFSMMPLYSHSTNATEIADYLFGAHKFIVSGSRSKPIRGSQELLADYFGLPLDYLSTISFKPVIHNALVDISFYKALDEWYPGLYIKAHVPVGATIWDMRLHENVISPGKESYPTGYMSSSQVPRSDMMVDMREYFSGIKTVGDIQPLAYSKIAGPRVKAGVSDVQVDLGINILATPDYHFGLSICSGIPTSNHATGQVMFEPILGNGGHWELGLGMTGHAFFWDSENGKHSFSLGGDINVTHLFASRQRRSFDLKKNGPASRYILIQEIGTPVVQGLTVNNTPVVNQYHGKLMSAVNKTTLEADVSIALQVDAAVNLTYTSGPVQVDVGYNLWARTAEQLSRKECLESNSFAVKGDAQVYGFTVDDTQFVALNATQSEATINAGQGSGNANLEFKNLNADNAEFNDLPVTAQFNTTILIPTVDTPSVAVSASDQAILLTDADIDNLSAASPSALSHTFFAHVSYTWDEHDGISPYCGVGGKITINGSDQKRNNALSEGALWIKSGVSF